ncbi:hypothetical protein [Eudoraea sp.]|uniref:hypothetical protein n=1 Tax=Eudoraea sp. TaxID=1979955 RepID=UPI003C77FCB8
MVGFIEIKIQDFDEYVNITAGKFINKGELSPVVEGSIVSLPMAIAKPLKAFKY